MKCIRIHEGNVVKRLPDDQAKALVEKKQADYVAKSYWKIETRDKGKTVPATKDERNDQAAAELREPRPHISSKEKRQKDRKGKAA